jgi:hypothetical protein
MNIANRLQAYSANNPLSMNRKIDFYLSENLADLMMEYKIADRKDLEGIDSEFETLESRMDNLYDWKNDFSNKLISAENRMKRLKLKAGME